MFSLPLSDALKTLPRPKVSRFRGAIFGLCALLVLAGAHTASAFDTVVIDAGHGGHDRGASIGYVFEKHLALDTARRVEQLLRKQGLKVIMTRSTDVFIPLQGRSAIGNREGNALFVSIHYNYNKSGSGHGLETFYCHDRSYMLAGFIQAYLIQETRLQNRGVKHANFHVIRATSRNPAVLVECGFVSNSAERAGMMTGLYRERIAVGVAKGILAFKQK
jgi:N-acetylmuramoyl-L-alanine amidase